MLASGVDPSVIDGVFAQRDIAAVATLVAHLFRLPDAPVRQWASR